LVETRKVAQKWFQFFLSFNQNAFRIFGASTYMSKANIQTNAIKT